MGTDPKHKSEELCGEYLPKQQAYREFSEAIGKIIREVLSDGGIKIYAITTREKDPEKLKEKVVRKAQEGVVYEALESIEDLAGVRVVTYLESQREQAVGLIYRAFETSNPKVETKYEPQGYRGTHLILGIDQERGKLAEYAKYRGLKCEVQVSSVLYHAWSEIEHDVIYKPGDDREKLASLGLDDIENSFQEIMAQHLEEATIQFDLLYKKHKEVLHAGAVIYSDFVSDIKTAESNDLIASILDVGDKFSHKKSEEAVRMAEEVIRKTPLEPKVIHKFGSREIHGKTHEDLLEKCVEILMHFHIRYWNTERILGSLFVLALNKSKKVSESAIKGIRETAKYNNSFIKRYKNLYPQKASLDFIKAIPESNRKKNLSAIAAIAEEILSSAVEGTEWTTAETMTFSSGALVPNDGLKKMRQETIDLIAEIYTQSSDPKDQLLLTQVLLTALEAPHTVAYGDDLIEMIRADTIHLVSVVENFIFDSEKISNYLVAQEIEKSLIRLLRSDRFKTEEAKALYDRLQKDADYSVFCTLVGDIQEYRSLDEDWGEAEKRRTEEVKTLVESFKEDDLEVWITKLNAFSQPLKDGAIDVWKYGTFKTFIVSLSDQNPPLAEALMRRVVIDDAPLAQEPFVSSYLYSLRRRNEFVLWDTFVSLICEKKIPALATSIALSLNLDNGVDLKTAIREADVEILSKIVKHEEPFDFALPDDFSLRYMVMNALTRIFEVDHAKMEALMVEEIKTHPTYTNIYFRELPFASHRKWMSFKSWSTTGITFIKNQIVALPDLDWHVQEMMLELGAEPFETITEIFQSRIMKDKEDNARYDVVPYHFNPDLQKYIATHEKYVSTMVEWLKDMTEDWSTYNWNVTHFIQRIGGASYSSILMRLIESSDRASLEKASYALQALDGANFDLCFEIVKRTDDKDILRQIAGAMTGMGVVNGEDGIARAYEAKAKQLEPYTSSDDERVKKFANEMKKAFEESAKAEFQRANTRKKTRELEFRG